MSQYLSYFKEVFTNKYLKIDSIFQKNKNYWVDNMSVDDREKFPVDALNLASMTETEWYLIVLGPETSDKIQTEYFSGLVNGCLSEIVKRGVESIDAFMWGMVGVTQEDGSPLRAKRDGFDEYIFRIQSAEFPEGMPPVLKGPVRKYSTDSNFVGDIGEMVTVHFVQTPTFKRDLGYQPLG